MDPARAEQLYRLEHRHKDGSWAQMVEDRSHHSPAEHDPERAWSRGHFFRCKTCDETAIIIPPEE
jgi:hypothetical protein